MTAEHNDVATTLLLQLASQLDRTAFRLRLSMGHVRHPAGSYYIPDVFVIPIALSRAQLGRRTLEVYEAPLPLVVEVWSPSTGEDDIDSKVPEYQRRGDLEVWRIHPFERTLTAWRRQADGTYVEALYVGGIVQPTALPNVTIDLDTFSTERRHRKLDARSIRVGFCRSGPASKACSYWGRPLGQFGPEVRPRTDRSVGPRFIGDARYMNRREGTTGSAPDS